MLAIQTSYNVPLDRRKTDRGHGCILHLRKLRCIFRHGNGWKSSMLAICKLKKKVMMHFQTEERLIANSMCLLDTEKKNYDAFLSMAKTERKICLNLYPKLEATFRHDKD